MFAVSAVAGVSTDEVSARLGPGLSGTRIYAPTSVLLPEGVGGSRLRRMARDGRLASLVWAACLTLQEALRSRGAAELGAPVSTGSDSIVSLDQRPGEEVRAGSPQRPGGRAAPPHAGREPD